MVDPRRCFWRGGAFGGDGVMQEGAFGGRCF